MDDIERYHRDQREQESRRTGCGVLFWVVVIALMWVAAQCVAPFLV